MCCINESRLFSQEGFIRYCLQLAIAATRNLTLHIAITMLSAFAISDTRKLLLDSASCYVMRA